MAGNGSDEFLTVEELAERLKIAPGTIYNWVSRGEIPYVKIGRAVRFRRADIDAWIEGQGSTTPAENTASDPAA